MLPFRLPRAWPRLPALLGIAAAATGCGHSASREECEAIFVRTAEIELAEQKIQDPAEVAKKVEEVRVARGDVIDECIGKRITTKAVECVKRADTTAKVDACLE
jgi:hypothetical protein